LTDRRVDRWLGATLAIVALIWLWLVRTYIPDIRTEGEPGPRGFPFLLGIALAVLGITLAVRAAVAGRTRISPRPEDHADALSRTVTRREVRSVAGTFALLILYAFLLDKIGFLLATPVVMTAAMAGLLRIRRPWSVASLVIAFTVGCWMVFNVLLGTPLPRGAWLLWL
jgi:hypothetical protein